MKRARDRTAICSENGPAKDRGLEERGVRFDFQYVSDSVEHQEAEDRDPFAHSPTGLVPQFRGVPVSTSEIGFAPGKKATTVRAFDTVESRKGYSGLYQFGASHNPGKFTTTLGVPQSGDYLLYWMASNEPLPLPIHNTISLGYIQNRLSQQFVPPGAPPWAPEHAIEFNVLLDPLPMILLQPVIQYVMSGKVNPTQAGALTMISDPGEVAGRVVLALVAVALL